MNDLVSHGERLRLRRKASGTVLLAVRAGRLPNLRATRIPCTDCRVADAVCYDHRNYYEPLIVQPVCHPCNMHRGAATPLDEGIIDRRARKLAYRRRDNYSFFVSCTTEQYAAYRLAAQYAGLSPRGAVRASRAQRASAGRTMSDDADVTEAEFRAYERVRKSGRFNMITQSRYAAAAAGLSNERYRTVSLWYSEARKKYGVCEVNE